MRSTNGWNVLEERHTQLWVIPGTERHLRLTPGPAGFLLTHLALWFHEAVEPLDAGPWDDWAYDRRLVTGSSFLWSCHSSGTAVDLNATLHPYGQRNTFRADQARRIRTRLERAYGGAIRWGGDFQTTRDEMHFEIALGPDPIAAVAGGLRNSRRGRRVRHSNPGFAG